MISVILLAHNYGKYLSECLDSIISNDNSLIGEIIIINDQSVDNTKEIVDVYKKKMIKLDILKLIFCHLQNLTTLVFLNQNLNL